MMTGLLNDPECVEYRRSKLRSLLTRCRSTAPDFDRFVKNRLYSVLLFACWNFGYCFATELGLVALNVESEINDL